MNIYVFTNGRPYFRPGWHDEDVITVFSNVTVDLVNAPPVDDAVLSVLVVFGNATVIVPVGAQIAVGGVSLFGKRTITIKPDSAGPRMQLTLSGVFGNINVIEESPNPLIAGVPKPSFRAAPAPSSETSYPQAMTGQTVKLQPEEQI